MNQSVQRPLIAPSGPPPVDGHGRRAIDDWVRCRTAAGLPDVGQWDGPLISLALAMMWDKGVAEETIRFMAARRPFQSEPQIQHDICIGQACIAEINGRTLRRRIGGIHAAASVTAEPATAVPIQRSGPTSGFGASTLMALRAYLSRPPGALS